uniref:Autophagy-related protein 101 n=1 Tax=Molossus molossus TaxID=27622 RepID=A0A7J8FVH9_MOLMO|nr:autophagy related 101 [Molossus molossus]
MNCRSEVLEVSVEGRQVEEAMLAVLHTVLLHRSTGKFHYKKEGTYSIGTVGTQDVDCDFIDFTYVRVSSEELDRALRKVVGEFKDALRNSGGDGLGQMSLEFYQKKKSRWPFSDECIPWEVWTVKVHVVALATEQERQICREKVGEKLCEKIINIVEVMNRHEYLPKMPTQSEVDNVFDTGLRDVQPYLYKISFQITDALGTSVTTTMRRLLDGLQTLASGACTVSPLGLWNLLWVLGKTWKGHSLACLMGGCQRLVSFVTFSDGQVTTSPEGPLLVHCTEVPSLGW